MRDPQRNRLYGWEGEWAGWKVSHISLAKVRRVARWACDKYGLPHPTVKQHSTPCYSFCRGSLLSFNTEIGKNTATALHEAAHYICDKIFTQENLADHSPEWLGVYLWLLEHAGVAPRIALHSSAAARRLRWAPASIVSPLVLKAKADVQRRNRRHGRGGAGKLYKGRTQTNPAPSSPDSRSP